MTTLSSYLHYIVIFSLFEAMDLVSLSRDVRSYIWNKESILL